MTDLPIDNERPEQGSEGVPRENDPNPPPDISIEWDGPLGTAAGVLDFFVRNDGLGEDPDGSNHNWITEWYGVTGPWCAMTVSRALLESGFTRDSEHVEVPGVEQTTHKGWAYVPYMRQNFEDAGRFYSADPLPGDLVIFNWDGDRWGDHVGVFQEDLGDGTCLCWEGNTSQNLLHVRRRSYDVIDGFCRPPYGEQDDGYPGLLRLGSRGEAVRRLQQRLADRRWTIDVDGDFGPETERVVKEFQANEQLEIDGIVGPITWARIFAPMT